MSATSVLNSDTQVFFGALGELRRAAAADPMIGFVSPRSNHATICSLPLQDEFHNLPPEQAHANFLLLSRYLPDYQFVPTAVGFCLLIRWEMLKGFGFLAACYGSGYHEENDLIVRANRCGFRAAMANRAFVYHLGEASLFRPAPPSSARIMPAASTNATRNTCSA
jgi:GT2 family glycosyltransferase